MRKEAAKCFEAAYGVIRRDIQKYNLSLRLTRNRTFFFECRSPHVAPDKIEAFTQGEYDPITEKLHYSVYYRKAVLPGGTKEEKEGIPEQAIKELQIWCFVLKQICECEGVVRLFFKRSLRWYVGKILGKPPKIREDTGDWLQKWCFYDISHDFSGTPLPPEELRYILVDPGTHVSEVIRHLPLIYRREKRVRNWGGNKEKDTD